MRLLIFAAIFVAASLGCAHAGIVSDIPSISALRTSGGSGATSVIVDGYSTANDGGGGQFVRNGVSCSDDDGVVIQDQTTSHYCWYRQFSGPVHLPWYGVKDATSPDCLTDMASCAADKHISYGLNSAVANAIATAKQAAGFGGDGGVTTDGRSIVIYNANLDIPENQYFTCSGTPGGARLQTGDNAKPYWTLPNSIVLNPTYTVTREKQSRISDCIIRPTWYIQQSKPTAPFNIPAESASDLVQLVRKFTGLATSCTGKNCPMEDMFIIGFDTCEDNDLSLKTVLSDLQEECLVDEWIHNNGGGMKLQNFASRPYLEGSYDDSVKRPQWNITNVTLSGTDSVDVSIDTSTMSADDLASGGFDTILIAGLGKGNSIAPVSANGRWLTASVSSGGTSADVVLTGASWVGPTDSNASWKAGTSVIGVLDTTNIIAGQYVCASGTAPICTQPSGFTASYIVSSDINSLGSANGTIHILTGTLAGWPVSGIVLVSSEQMAYTIVDSGTIAITDRGVNNTSKTTHLNTEHIVPAAPRVVGVVPTSDAVIVSAVAQTTCASSCGNVTFANNTTVKTGGTLGTLILNPSYHTWTWNNFAGPNPSGVLTVMGSGDAPSRKLTPTKNLWKIQPGMIVADLTTPANVTNGTSNGGTVSTVNGDGTVTLDSGDTVHSFGSDKLLFSGCGYPPNEPWKGNCASTTLLLGGTNNAPPPDDNEEEAQGPTCEYMHSFGNEIQVHVINAPTTDCTNFVIAGGGGVGDQLDPDSIGLWFEGNATKTQFTNGRIAGAVVSILDVPSPQSSGIGISNAEVPGHIIVGPDSDLVLTGLHGNMPSGDFVYVSGTTASLQASGISLPLWTMYFDDPIVLPRIYCAGNAFATPACSQVKTAPTCPASSGCTSVAGTDSDFDVTTNGSATSVTVMLAANYPAKPICRVTPGATSGGAAVNSSVSSVNWQPYGTTVTFKTNNAVTHLYGSCHGPTG